jgi:hypothetical protein
MKAPKRRAPYVSAIDMMEGIDGIGDTVWLMIDSYIRSGEWVARTARLTPSVSGVSGICAGWRLRIWLGRTQHYSVKPTKHATERALVDGDRG